MESVTTDPVAKTGERLMLSSLQGAIIEAGSVLIYEGSLAQEVFFQLGRRTKVTYFLEKEITYIEGSLQSVSGSKLYPDEYPRRIILSQCRVPTEEEFAKYNETAKVV